MPRSIVGRMILLSALSIAVALMLAAWIIGGVLEHFVREGLDRRLDSEITLLASVVGPDGSVDEARLRQRAPSLEQRPGWQWQIAGPRGSAGSTAFTALRPHPERPHRRQDPQDDGPGAGPTGDNSFTTLDGRGRDGRPLHARRLVLSTAGGKVTIIASAPRAVVSRPIRAAAAPLLAALAALGVLLAAATLVQLRLGFRPLRQLRAQLAALRQGELERVDEDQPHELKPLAEELNALAADNRQALATARLSAANLAHALKTPVATLAIDLRDDPQILTQVGRIEATIRHHLARASAETANRRASTRLAPIVADLASTIARMHGGRAPGFELDIPADMAVAMDGQDLAELLGNLIDNAARHARTRVIVRAGHLADDQRRIRVEIEDDGAGIPADQRARVLGPGGRLDERPDGHGFGLSIASDLAALYGGTLSLDDAAAGGLRVELVLPSPR